jgi:hypothetical protein
MDWIYLSQEREEWSALVNTVMIFRFSYIIRKFFSIRSTWIQRNNYLAHYLVRPV